MFKDGEKLTFTRADGGTEDCEFMCKGFTPGCVVVLFYDKDGRPKGMDGLTVPIGRLKRRV